MTAFASPFEPLMLGVGASGFAQFRPPHLGSRFNLTIAPKAALDRRENRRLRPFFFLAFVVKSRIVSKAY
jgi:hypothetical protein